MTPASLSLLQLDAFLSRRSATAISKWTVAAPPPRYDPALAEAGAGADREAGGSNVEAAMLRHGNFKAWRTLSTSGERLGVNGPAFVLSGPWLSPREPPEVTCRVMPARQRSSEHVALSLTRPELADEQRNGHDHAER